MFKTRYTAESRGHANHGWLDTWHTFSFAHYYNPERMHFGAMRVFNDDTVSPGAGFGTHPHDNMEIISIPLQGSLQHKDSSGHGGVIAPGDVQVMSAGTGIQHSEFNASASDTVNFFQIWIFPNEEGVEPRYTQRSFDLSKADGQWQLLVSPDGAEDSLWIHQDAFISRLHSAKDQRVSYRLRNPNHGVFVMVIEGQADLYEDRLNRRDAMRIIDATEDLEIAAKAGSDLLLVEVPMNL